MLRSSMRSFSSLSVASDAWTFNSLELTRDFLGGRVMTLLTLHTAHSEAGAHVTAERVIDDNGRDRVEYCRCHHQVPRRLVAVQELPERDGHGHLVGR